MRIAEFQFRILQNWNKFTIWNAGKQGKQFYKSLTDENKNKVVAFCDVDLNKLNRANYQPYCNVQRKVTATIPIIHHSNAVPPVVICVKQDLTDGMLETYIASHSWVEGEDFYFLS